MAVKYMKKLNYQSTHPNNQNKSELKTQNVIFPNYNLF